MKKGLLFALVLFSMLAAEKEDPKPGQVAIEIDGFRLLVEEREGLDIEGIRQVVQDNEASIKEQLNAWIDKMDLAVGKGGEEGRREQENLSHELIAIIARPLAPYIGEINNVEQGVNADGVNADGGK